MKKSAFILILFFFVINTSGFVFSEDINLVELQKKEKKRREKAKKAKYKITNDNITTFNKSKNRISFIKVDNETTDKEPQKKKKIVEEDPKKKEKYWRNRMSIVNKNINACRSSIVKTQSNLNQAQTNFLIADIPEKINQARVLVIKLTKELEELKAQLTMFEKKKEDLYTEARKAGAPPGWLR